MREAGAGAAQEPLAPAPGTADGPGGPADGARTASAGAPASGTHPRKAARERPSGAAHRGGHGSASAVTLTPARPPASRGAPPRSLP